MFRHGAVATRTVVKLLFSRSRLAFASSYPGGTLGVHARLTATAGAIMESFRTMLVYLVLTTTMLITFHRLLPVMPVAQQLAFRQFCLKAGFRESPHRPVPVSRSRIGTLGHDMIELQAFRTVTPGAFPT